MPPETPNGVITQYSIQYGETVIDNFGSKTSSKLMGTVKGLSPDTTYTLQLRVHTKVGPGPPSSLTVKTCKLLNSKRYYLTNSFYFAIYNPATVTILLS